MKPKTDRPLSPGACRLNVALAVTEGVVALILAITLFQALDGPKAVPAPAVVGAIFALLVLGASGIVHTVFAMLARRGDAGSVLTTAALVLGFINVPWGTGVAFYTWMRLNDPAATLEA